jgi:hypothetical protein
VAIDRRFEFSLQISPHLLLLELMSTPYLRPVDNAIWLTVLGLLSVLLEDIQLFGGVLLARLYICAFTAILYLVLISTVSILPSRVDLECIP